jgi:hypothetical protein
MVSFMVMGTRQAINPKLRQKFSPEILQLFAKLEAVPLRKRRARWWRDTHKHFMCDPLLLDMGDEFWMCQSPLDRSPNYYSPRECAHDAWHACRHLRIALLAATGLDAQSSRAH